MFALHPLAPQAPRAWNFNFTGVQRLSRGLWICDAEHLGISGCAIFLSKLAKVSAFAILDELLRGSTSTVARDQRGQRFIFVHSVSEPEMRQRILLTKTVSQVYYHGLGWRQPEEKPKVGGSPRKNLSKPFFVLAVVGAFTLVTVLLQATGSHAPTNQAIKDQATAIVASAEPKNSNEPNHQPQTRLACLKTADSLVSSIDQIGDPSLLAATFAEQFEAQGASIVINQLIQLGGYAQLNFTVKCKTSEPAEIKMLSVMQKQESTWSVSSIQRD